MTRNKKSIEADGKANKETRMGFRATEEERQIISRNPVNAASHRVNISVSVP